MKQSKFPRRISQGEKVVTIYRRSARGRKFKYRLVYRDANGRREEIASGESKAVRRAKALLKLVKASPRIQSANLIDWEIQLAEILREES